MAALNEIYAQVRMSGEVTAEEALRARRAIYGKGGPLTSDEVETLLRIEEATDRCDPDWETLLAEATIDFLLHEREPTDVVDDVKAGWLLDRIVLDGRVKTARQFELLVRVLEEANGAPEPLIALALRQVKAAVIDGDGPLAGIQDTDPGRVTAEEASLVRRILFAFGSYGGGAVTRAEAEILFDINDAATGDNHPEWSDLFVKAIANCVMAASGYQAPPRDVALAAEDRVPHDRDNASITGFFTDFVVQGLRGIIGTYRPPQTEQWSASERSEVDDVDRNNAVWLAQRIGRDGKLDENEKALLRFLRDEAGSVHPALRELIARAA